MFDHFVRLAVKGLKVVWSLQWKLKENRIQRNSSILSLYGKTNFRKNLQSGICYTRCKLYDTEASNLVCIILFKAIFYLEKNKQFYIQKSWLAIQK